MCLRVANDVFVCACVRACVRACVCMRVHVPHVYTYVYVCVCVCVCVCSIPAFQRLIFWIAGVSAEDAATIAAPVVEAVSGLGYRG